MFAFLNLFIYIFADVESRKPAFNDLSDAPNDASESSN